MKPPMPSAPYQQTNPIRIPAAEGYRLWSRTYDTDANPLLALELRSLSHKLNHIAGKVFLDVACGTGRWMATAAGKGAKAIGVDLSLEMLAVARGKPLVAGRLVRADSHCLPFADQSADMVMCSFSLGYMHDQDRLIQELGRVTRRGGTVLVSDFHPCAHDMGWRRSFRSGQNVFEIENHRYSCEQWLDSGRSAGLELREIIEPHLGEPEQLIMRRAGKEQWFNEVSVIPAVLSIEWERR